MTLQLCRTILLVDDDPRVLEMLADLFQDDYEVLTAASGEAAVAAATDAVELAVVVMDIKMAGMDGIIAARRIRDVKPQTPIIFHTGYPGEYNEGDIDHSEQPFDYVQKGKSLPQLLRSVRNAVESYHLRRNDGGLAQTAESSFGMIARSASMMQVFQVMHKVCASDSKVMILGETGTGKELVARAIHAGSKRRNHHFAVLNCDNKAPDLVAAELFGSLPGSYTDAIEERIGLFAFADRGTVFLDEVGDLNSDIQLRLLRVLETGVYQKIGSPEEHRADIRVLCATHRDLEKMVREKTFREDLYYRLKGVTIQLPPLRERKEDIQPLVRKFSARFTVEEGLPPKLFDVGAIDELMRHDWPGNVRELLEAVEALIVLCDSEIIFGSDVCRYLRRSHPGERELDTSLMARVRSYERVLIVEALAAAHNNVAVAAKQLEMDRSNLAKKIRALGIDTSGPEQS